MRYSNGNEKLGNTLVISRPVGTSCPNTCPFLGNGCYAEHTEKQYKATRPFAMANLVVSESEIRSLIDNAVASNKAVRIHERGDFCRDNKLDLPYIKAWIQAIKSSSKLPHIYTYTHKLVKTLAKLPISVYASVHNERDIIVAQQAGFKLFAYCSEIQRSKRHSNRHIPTFINLPIIGRTLVCPEQRLGRKKITCDKCRWCIEGKDNVMFLKH